MIKNDLSDLQYLITMLITYENKINLIIQKMIENKTVIDYA